MKQKQKIDVYQDVTARDISAPKMGVASTTQKATEFILSEPAKDAASTQAASLAASA